VTTTVAAATAADAVEDVAVAAATAMTVVDVAAATAAGVTRPESVGQ